MPPLTPELATDHRLIIKRLTLLGGGRSVVMRSGLNVVRGNITTGKTTFVRLVRAALGTVPDGLPPEVASVRALQTQMQLGNSVWRNYRPLVTTADVAVELASEATDSEFESALRIKASGATKSYSAFLLEHLALPVVVIPEGTVGESTRLNPVSMTDWLGYCIITGDELDSEVFGHRDQFRNRKRRVIFELVYGLFDKERSNLLAERRGIELRLNQLDQEVDIVSRFLSGTPYGDAAHVDVLILEAEAALRAKERGQTSFAEQSASIDNGAVGLIRDRFVDIERSYHDARKSVTFIDEQISELQELVAQLKSQSAKITRAIVADEWLVDFDFLVCPRCGNGVNAAGVPDKTCYLCGQTHQPENSRETLLSEQTRISMQVQETEQLIMSRSASLHEEQINLVLALEALTNVRKELDHATAAFVSSQASRLTRAAAEVASLKGTLEKLKEYRGLFRKQEDRAAERAELRANYDELTVRIENRSVSNKTGDTNVTALEGRFHEYLERLQIPQLADTLTVKINRRTYMPEVSGRSFDELSSQGLKTLVNCAHALAHHTVAIDLGLPLPGLLILDGLSANSGSDGFDHDRILDLYQLIIDVCQSYSETLQVIIVDNAVPLTFQSELASREVLVLSQEDRLIVAATDPVIEESDGEVGGGASDSSKQ